MADFHDLPRICLACLLNRFMPDPLPMEPGAVFVTAMKGVNLRKALAHHLAAEAQSPFVRLALMPHGAWGRSPNVNPTFDGQGEYHPQRGVIRASWQGEREAAWSEAEHGNCVSVEYLGGHFEDTDPTLVATEETFAPRRPSVAVLADAYAENQGEASASAQDALGSGQAAAEKKETVDEWPTSYELIGSYVRRRDIKQKELALEAARLENKESAAPAADDEPSTDIVPLLEDSDHLELTEKLRFLLQKAVQKGIDVKAAFAHFDSSGDGEIEKPEFIRALQELGPSLGLDDLINFKPVVTQILQPFLFLYRMRVISPIVT